MLLLKTRVSNIREIANSLYINDKEFLGSSTIDSKLDQLIAAVQDSFCYKVTTANGMLVGFFCAPLTVNKKVSAFYIAKLIRENPEVLAEFWALVSQTVFGKIFESITLMNVAEQEFKSILDSDVTISEPGKFFGINYDLNY